MRTLTLLFFMTLLATLSGCVNRIIKNPELSELPEARNDAALVFFFKPNNHDHSVYHHHDRSYYEYVKDEDDFLGAVTEGSFFFAFVTPGEHEFSCTPVDLDAGQTYYLEHYVAYVRIHLDATVTMSREPLLLCPPQFVERTTEYARPIIADLSYTIVSME